MIVNNTSPLKQILVVHAIISHGKYLGLGLIYVGLSHKVTLISSAKNEEAYDNCQKIEFNITTKNGAVCK